MVPPVIEITLPDWATTCVDWERPYSTDEEKMGVAIEVARRNVLEGTGGPFGAAIFEEESGWLVSVGMNLVVAHNNCLLHGEMVAFMTAQARVGSFTLCKPDLPAHTLATSCEPCAMCLGATLWSGVSRVITGATRDDAIALRFDEGPVFPQSYAYLEERGVAFTRNVCRAEAAAVLELYRNRSGVIYNR
ncbi:MAG TPA: nucleoside deaminase [Rhodothermales bacterium]|nr:nucleoside deaminase [Rhodothermales bacterium]